MGSWRLLAAVVMNDEANSHYFAITEQMMEGNMWLADNVGVVPKNAWAIDPFGYSATMAYVLSRMGFENMLIQRTHYEVKKELALHQNLELLWRQVWDLEGTADMFVHMMPFYSYDVPHTCGPEPAVCCQFDFARTHGFSYESCPRGERPVEINPSNVQEKALKLLDQYRKKFTLSNRKKNASASVNDLAGPGLLNPSLLSHRVSDHSNYPMHICVSKKAEEISGHRPPKSFSPLISSLPCDVHIVGFKVPRPLKFLEGTTKDLRFLLILQKRGWDTSYCNKGGFGCSTLTNGVFDLFSIFKDLTIQEARATSLNTLHDILKRVGSIDESHSNCKRSLVMVKYCFILWSCKHTNWKFGANYELKMYGRQFF